MVKPLALAALALAGCAHARAVAADDPAALQKRDADWSAEVAARGLTAWVDGFADDGVMIPAGVPLTRGRAAIRELMAGAFDDPGFKLSWTPTEAHVAGALGWTSGSFTSMSSKGAHSGKYVTVWRRLSDGRWKVAADIGNTDPPH